MLVKCLKSFTGKVSGHKNELLTIDDPELVNDLIQAKYVESCESKKKSVKPVG